MSGASNASVARDSFAVDADQRARAMVAHELGRTLFVEAGAGTGKTTALVRRITELVLADDAPRRVPLSAIAAITFTEAAAAELRERIRIEFEERLRAAHNSGDHAIVERCSQALKDADSAAISTLHSFAQRLLSEFPVEVGIPPRVEVVDEVRSQVAFDDRWSGFVDELFADADIEEFIVRASILRVGIGSARSPLRQLAQIFDDNWDRFDGVELATPLATSIDWQSLMEPVQQLIETCDWCRADDDGLLVELREQCITLDRFLSSRSDIDRLRLLRRMKDFSVGRKGKAGDWDGRKPEVQERSKALKAAAVALHDELANQTLTLLAVRIAEFTRAAAHERRAEGVLEFHDLLVLARQLLRESPEARAALSDRYRVIMLDEFQDTDPIQIELALLLAGSRTDRFTGEWSDLDADPGRLFMVGDPKQSIYRFRRADITLFLDVQKKFTDGGVALTQNFRTVQPIIDAVNTLFDERMPEASESQAKYSPLTATRDPSPVDHRPLVIGGPADLRAGELRRREASDVADVVDDIRNNPDRWLVGDERDPGVWRHPTLADVTILLPTRTSLPQLTDALDARAIPFRADTGTLIYETQEVRELLMVLRAIDDPSNEVALVGALRTLLYACGDDDLYRWRDGNGAWDFRTSVPDELQGTPVHLAMEHLRTLADRRWWDEPSQLLMRLIDERRVFAVAAAGRNSRDRWRRLRYVVDQARAFAESGGGDLRDYLRWTDLQGRDGARAHEPMLPEPDDDSVHIMTVHGSKGLEFPITIVSGLTTQLRPGHRGVAVDWGSPGSLPQVKISSSLKTALFDRGADLEAEMDEGEKERLLYVALTRARDHLVISSHHQPPKEAKTKPGKAEESDKGPKSHGRTIFEFAEDSGRKLVRRFSVVEQETLFSDEPGGGGATPTGPDEITDRTELVPSPREWRLTHEQVIARASVTRVRSATAIATAAAAQLDTDAPAIGSDDTEPWDESQSEASLPPTTFRRGRAGTAIGSAVHAVLQFVDLSDPDPAEVERLVAAQAWAESVPEHGDTILRSVQSALAAPIVESCRTARHWKELYVAAPAGELTIEGYVDLLVERDDGLVVVDYKTDSVASEREIEAKLSTYALQGASYALAVETSTARTVADVQFVFARPDGPVVRSVPNLDALVDRVREIATSGMHWQGAEDRR